MKKKAAPIAVHPAMVANVRRAIQKTPKAGPLDITKELPAAIEEYTAACVGNELMNRLAAQQFVQAVGGINEARKLLNELEQR